MITFFRYDASMLIGMSEAAKRLGLGSTTAVRELLKRNSVPLVEIHARAYAVEESDLEAFMKVRRGRGRPPKDGSTGEEQSNGE